jgi:hypothetical protein
VTTRKSSKSSQAPKPKSSAPKEATSTPSPSLPTADAKPPGLSKFQGFVVERRHRSVAKNAPYNPRGITPEARAKLRAGLKAFGLLEPPIWNRKTGNLVGSHRRLEELDALMGTPDYMLDFAVVDLDPTREVEANILLNNPNAQGHYEVDQLAELLKTPDLELSSTGSAAPDSSSSRARSEEATR